MKKAFDISLRVALCVGVIILLGFISREKEQVRCSGLEITIDRSDNNYFIQEEEIRELFFNLGYNVDSQLLGKVNTRKIEQQVYNNSSALKADVYTTVDGKVKIDIKQKRPLLRVFNESGESFYIDEEGWLMPLSSKFTPRVPLANGHISETYSMRYKSCLMEERPGDTVRDVLRELFLLTKYIGKNEFWNAQIIQLFVNSNSEIELIPRVGNHTILFGDISGMEEKFEKLMIFYKEGLKKAGWNNYTHINLKFKNQVVCWKN